MDHVRGAQIVVHPFLESYSLVIMLLSKVWNKAKRILEQFLKDNNEAEVLTWPPNSPDLDPIQCLWDGCGSPINRDYIPYLTAIERSVLSH